MEAVNLQEGGERS